MPAYNAERYIGAAIESILGQTFRNWELIIVNDGSTDTTSERIRSYKDPRIRCFDQANAGPAVAYNRAIAESRAQFFAICNADDLCHSDRLEYQLQSYLSGTRRALFSVPDFIDSEDNPMSDGHFLTGRFRTAARIRGCAPNHKDSE